MWKQKIITTVTIVTNRIKLKLRPEGVLRPGDSQGQGFQHTFRGKGLIAIMTYLSIKENKPKISMLNL